MFAAVRPLGGPTQLASTVTSLAVLVFFLADGIAVRHFGGRGRRRVGRSDRGTYLWILVTVIAAFLIGLYAPRWLPDLDVDAWIWPLGVIAILAGTVVRVWAIATLGHSFRRFVTIDEGQQVVDRGPYRWVRHPSYLGVLLAIGGLGLAQANVLSFVGATVCTIAGLVPRIHVEERALMDALGEPYRAFAATRARLVPAVW
jgi:protein-S-isoprenylcysteine O-methyltransferase Ste14